MITGLWLWFDCDNTGDWLLVKRGRDVHHVSPIQNGLSGSSLQWRRSLTLWQPGFFSRNDRTRSASRARRGSVPGRSWPLPGHPHRPASCVPTDRRLIIAIPLPSGRNMNYSQRLRVLHSNNTHPVALFLFKRAAANSHKWINFIC